MSLFSPHLPGRSSRRAQAGGQAGEPGKMDPLRCSPAGVPRCRRGATRRHCSPVQRRPTHALAASWGRRPPRAARRCENTARPPRSRWVQLLTAVTAQLSGDAPCSPCYSAAAAIAAAQFPAAARTPQLVRRGACQGAKQGASLGECTRRLGQPGRRGARARWPRRSDACNAHRAARVGAGLGFALCRRRLALNNPRRVLFRRCAYSRAPPGSDRAQASVSTAAGRPHLLGRPPRPVLAPSAAPPGGGRAPAQPTRCRARLLRAQRGR